MKNLNVFLRSSIALAVLALMNQASAQDTTTTAAPDTNAVSTASATAPERIEITGSSIRRPDAEEALPVTIIKADEFIKRGYTTVADVVQSLSVTQTSIQGSVAAGTIANFRGLGLNRTLVLLDGQRLANEPTEDGYVNIDLIPISALDRVEILRDGASSIYGSDAMAGVLNFITKRSYNGLEVTAQGVAPTAGGGGDERRISAIGGLGNLNTDGWNIWGTIDLHQTSELPLSARSEVSGPAYLDTLFPPASTGQGGYAFPANITSPSKAEGNPYAGVCAAPYSIPGTKNTCVSNDTNLYSIAQDQRMQTSGFLKGTVKLTSDNTLTVQALFADVTINEPKDAAATSKGFSAYPGGAKAPVMQISTASPYYPGGSGGVPSVSGVTGQTLTLEWEGNQYGPAYYQDSQKNARLLVSDTGHWNDWEYKVNLDLAKEVRYDTALTGYFNNTLMNTAVLSGINGVFINPFGAQSASGQALMSSLSESGAQLRDTHDAYDSLNFTVNRDVMQLPAGPLAMSFGGDYHYDSMSDVSPENNANISYNGRVPYDVHASRDVVALFGELDIPITKELDTDISARDDVYYTEGTTTDSNIKPKVSFRYQPTKAFLVRGSYNEGFHAPTLIDQYGYALPFATTTTSTPFDDPLLCPGGIPGVPKTGTALTNLPPGDTPSIVCNAKQNERTGANPDLKPETSEGGTLGFVVEPIENLTMSLDYWRVHMTNTIASPSATTIFENPGVFASDFVRQANGTLLYVNDINQNLGDTATDGFDVSAAYSMPNTSTGSYLVKLDGTYTDRYQFQLSPGGQWCQNVGQFGCGGGLSIAPVSSIPVMTFRWKDTLTAGWNKNFWGAQITDYFQTGYHDLNAQVAPYNNHTISSYSLVNLTGSYTGFRNTTINFGMGNVFNRMPPATNSASDGYLSNLASPIGRTVMAAVTYKFL